jgi:hypothetical protein
MQRKKKHTHTHTHTNLKEKMKCESVKAIKKILYSPWCNPKKNIVMKKPHKNMHKSAYPKECL